MGCGCAGRGGRRNIALGRRPSHAVVAGVRGGGCGWMGFDFFKIASECDWLMLHLTF